MSITKVRELDHSAKEMEPNVKMLVRDYQKVIDAVTSIEKLEKGREAIESERVRIMHYVRLHCVR